MKRVEKFCILATVSSQFFRVLFPSCDLKNLSRAIFNFFSNIQCDFKIQEIYFKEVSFSFSFVSINSKKCIHPSIWLYHLHPFILFSYSNFYRPPNPFSKISFFNYPIV